MSEVKKIVLDEIKKIAKRNPSYGQLKITENMSLFSRGSGFDSLDLAELIVRLGEIWGTDPVKEGASSVRTVKDLILFYEKKKIK